MSDEITIERGRIYVRFNYRADMVRRVREIADLHNVRKPFNDTTKAWSLPLRAALDISGAFPELPAPEEFGLLVINQQVEAEERAERERQAVAMIADNIGLVREALPCGKEMRDYQIEGAEWMARIRYGILADDMGLGKTMQSLVAAKVIRKAIGTATVCIVPANKISDWEQESDDVGVKPYIHSWSKQPDPEKVRRPFTLIADEAHYAQNLASLRTQNFLELARLADAVFLLTGTPMRNKKATNLFPLLVAIRHPLARNKSKYETRYCGARSTDWSKWVADGATNLPELRDHVRPYLKRRLKKDCLSLPPKTRVLEECELTKAQKETFFEKFEAAQRKYREKKVERILQLEQTARIEKWQPGKLQHHVKMQNGADATAILGQIRLAASIAKVPSAIEMAESVIEQDGQAIVFTAFRDTAIQIAHHFDTNAFVGGLSKDMQDRLKSEFQAGKTKIITGTLDSLGTGHNLTAANTVILMDRPLTPGDAEQAEDRAYRFGTKWPVTAYWLRAFKVCVAVDELLGVKQGVIDVVVNGAEAAPEMDADAGKLTAEKILGLLFLEAK